MDGSKWKTLLKWIIWGYHYFWKHPYMDLLEVHVFEKTCFLWHQPPKSSMAWLLLGQITQKNHDICCGCLIPPMAVWFPQIEAVAIFMTQKIGFENQFFGNSPVSCLEDLGIEIFLKKMKEYVWSIVMFEDVRCNFFEMLEVNVDIHPLKFNICSLWKMIIGRQTLPFLTRPILRGICYL